MSSLRPFSLGDRRRGSVGLQDRTLVILLRKRPILGVNILKCHEWPFHIGKNRGPLSDWLWADTMSPPRAGADNWAGVASDLIAYVQATIAITIIIYNCLNYACVGPYILCIWKLDEGRVDDAVHGILANADIRFLLDAVGSMSSCYFGGRAPATCRCNEPPERVGNIEERRRRMFKKEERAGP